MSSSGNIYLIGMPGSGKSSLGRKMATEFNLPFVDLDVEIEKREGIAIKDIFALHGEEHFRKVEHHVLHQVSEQKYSQVVATGGGTPCYFHNMEIMKRSGSSIFLNVSLDVIEERLRYQEKDQRPKFAHAKDMKSSLHDLYRERCKYYEQADYRWDGHQPITLLQDIVRAIIQKQH